MASAGAAPAEPAGPAPVQEPGLQRVDYAAPVDAPVVDRFRPPAGPYGPGNRGIDYGTRADQPVLAAGDGVVTFAGQVGGALHVTLRHADRLRTTYSFLATIAVAEGEPVARGEVVGTAGARLHLSARLGDAYLDPEVLLAASRAGGVRLVE